MVLCNHIHWQCSVWPSLSMNHVYLINIWFTLLSLWTRSDHFCDQFEQSSCLNEHLLPLTMRKRRLLFVIIKPIVCLLLIVSLLEFVVFWWIVARCRSQSQFADRSSIDSNHDRLNADQLTLRVLMVSDVHLLGSRHGFWADRLKREWQMHITFRLAVSHFEPNAVFFLGDSFDEGQIAGKVNLSINSPLSILQCKHS